MDYQLIKKRVPIQEALDACRRQILWHPDFKDAPIKDLLTWETLPESLLVPFLRQQGFTHARLLRCGYYAVVLETTDGQLLRISAGDSDPERGENRRAEIPEVLQPLASLHFPEKPHFSNAIHIEVLPKVQTSRWKSMQRIQHCVRKRMRQWYSLCAAQHKKAIYSMIADPGILDF